MNLLNRTRRLLQGLAERPPSRVQYYQVSCPEGHRLRGERTEGYQALRCPTCGEGMFVLPRSPLPEPVSRATSTTSRKPGPRASSALDDDPIPLSDPVFAHQQVVDPEVDGEIEWLEPSSEDQTALAPEIARPLQPAPPQGGDLAAQAVSAPAVDRAHPRTDAAARGPATNSAPARKPTPRPAGRATAKPVAQPEVLVVPLPRGERLAAWARRNRNPLIFSTVALLVITTIGVRFFRSRFEDLPRIVEVGREQGLVALDAGKFDTAHQLLSEARRAVDSLGGAVEGAEAIRQGAREAALLTSLVSDSLESILAEASPDPKEWSSRFDLLYRGKAIVIDAHLAEVPDASGSGRYDLDYRVIPVGEGAKPSRVGHIDLNGFRLLEGSHYKQGDRLIFGARLASFTHDPTSEEWAIGLEPESGVNFTHPKALEALGWPSVDELPEKDNDKP